VVEIADSARKHGIGDEDISYAVQNVMQWVTQPHVDRALLIGPARDGRLLEIVILDPDGDPLVIHADVCRPKFHDYLR
jgi:hypothetical protein